MQDRYAGDVGDFLNFGLLRFVLEAPTDPPLRLGILWYRVPDETHNDDGKHISYLLPGNSIGRLLRPLDPDLYERLKGLVAAGDRSVAAHGRAGIWPDGTVSYEDLLDLDRATLPTVAHRREHRDRWLHRGLAAVEDADVVFADPDNGIRRTDHPTPRHRAKAGKHAYLDELAPIVARGQSLVVYHHADRSAAVAEQARRRFVDLTEELGTSPLAAVRASRGSTRLFLFVPAARHREVLRDRLRDLESSPWAGELTVYWAAP